MIRVEKLSVRAGDFALDDISFEVPTGAYGLLMGRTGSGKTTILESLCGLRTVTAGRIVLMGEDVTKRKPAERGIGFVPQDAALFSTMRVRNQIGFALTIRKWSRRQIDGRVTELAELLGIGHLLDRRPVGLSGGEQQRVALGRALAAKPGVLCLDEPLSSLDDASREEMCSLLRSVRERTGVTTLHISHSKTDARLLADVLLLIKDRRVSPATLDELDSVDAGSSPVPVAGTEHVQA